MLSLLSDKRNKGLCMGQTFSSAWVTSSLSDFHFLGPMGTIDLALFLGLHWGWVITWGMGQAGDQGSREAGWKETAPLRSWASLPFTTWKELRHGDQLSGC